jgi:DnaD/phage-associated family protein
VAASASSFTGFRAGTRATAIPNSFFTLLYGEITDPAELLVTMYMFFVLGRQRGSPRCIPQGQLQSEAPLLRALSRLPGGAEQQLRAGVGRALQRGSLLIVGRSPEDEPLIALHTDIARRAAAEGGMLDGNDWTADSQAETERPNIYALYEENIGLIPPILLEDLEQAERIYPKPWIEAAFREAAANNRRSWKYIARILERWKLEGPDYETPGGSASVGAAGRGRTIGGPYRRVID